MVTNQLTLYTGNVKKQLDFAKLGLSIPLAKDIVDIKEIESDDPIEVISYKAKEVPPFHLIDDTVIYINRKPVTDIKFQLDKIKSEKPFAFAEMEFIVNLAYHDGENIYIYGSMTTGKIIPSLALENEDVFGFDDIFVPDFQGVGNMSYHKLKSDNPKMWLKANARACAIENLMANVKWKTVKICDLPKWEGEYQT